MNTYLPTSSGEVTVHVKCKLQLIHTNQEDSADSLECLFIHQDIHNFIDY